MKLNWSFLGSAEQIEQEYDIGRVSATIKNPDVRDLFETLVSQDSPLYVRTWEHHLAYAKNSAEQRIRRRGPRI